MPSASGSDNPMVQHAGHRNFEKLLRCGVRLFEYPHAAAPEGDTIDGVWSTVGASNFDERSFETNDETTLGLLDAALAQKLDAIFEEYVRRAEEVHLERRRERGLWHKLKDHTVYLINELL